MIEKIKKSESISKNKIVNIIKSRKARILSFSFLLLSAISGTVLGKLKPGKIEEICKQIKPNLSPIGTVVLAIILAWGLWNSVNLGGNQSGIDTGPLKLSGLLVGVILAIGIIGSQVFQLDIECLFPLLKDN